VRTCVFCLDFDRSIVPFSPVQVVRTRLRQESPQGKARKYSGLIQTIRIVLREEGAVAFYGGLSAHLLRVVPVSDLLHSAYGARSSSFILIHLFVIRTECRHHVCCV
jgi:hypothetical protein